MTLDEVRQRLSRIKQLGFVPTMRRGPTGIGYTLESLLEINENNISAPDLGTFELKAQREHHTGMTTLFTFNRKAWKMPPLDAVRKYGSPDKDGRLGIYYTMDLAPNSAGLFLSVEEHSVAVRSIDGSLIAEWQLTEITKRFNAKSKHLLLVKARVEERHGMEYFFFNRARLLSGGATDSILKNQFASGVLRLDLRLHDLGTMARNHGTGFRVYENDLEHFYQSVHEFHF